jgi:hypothetical protein
LQPLKSKKEVQDTTDPQQVPTLEVEADRSVLANDVVARVPSIQWMKKVEAKMKDRYGKPERGVNGSR